MVRGSTTKLRRLSPLLPLLLGVAGGANAASAQASAPAPPPRDPDVVPCSPPGEEERRRLPASDEAADNNWDIRFVNSTAELRANGNDEVYVRYDVGRGRDYNAELLASGCVSSLAGKVRPMVPVRRPKDQDHDSLSLGYTLDRSSSVPGTDLPWPSIVGFCHVLELVLPADEGQPELVVNTDTKEFEVQVIESYNFTVGLRGDAEEIEMTILGWVNLTGFDVGGLANDALEQTLEERAENATDALGRGQEFVSVEITEYGVEEGDSKYYYELVLREPCGAVEDCRALLNRTTMYENVTDALALDFDDGSFLDAFEGFWSASFAAFEGFATDKDPVPPLPDSLTFSFVGKPPDADVSDGRIEYLDGQDFAAIVQVVSVVESLRSEVDVRDFLEVCRCGGAGSFECYAADAPLRPNDELNVCIRSNSQAINVESIDSMVLTQGSAALSVIRDGEVHIRAITAREYVPAHNGAIVSTRVPSNAFAFAPGRSLAITGSVTTRLAGSGGRRRLIGQDPGASDGRDLRAVTEESPFRLEVILAAGEEGAPEAVASANSAAVQKKGVAAMGAVFGLVRLLLW